METHFDFSVPDDKLHLVESILKAKIPHEMHGSFCIADNQIVCLCFYHKSISDAFPSSIEHIRDIFANAIAEMERELNDGI